MPLAHEGVEREGGNSSARRLIVNSDRGIDRLDVVVRAHIADGVRRVPVAEGVKVQALEVAGRGRRGRARPSHGRGRPLGFFRAGRRGFAGRHENARARLRPFALGALRFEGTGLRELTEVAPEHSRPTESPLSGTAIGTRPVSARFLRDA